MDDTRKHAGSDAGDKIAPATSAREASQRGKAKLAAEPQAAQGWEFLAELPSRRWYLEAHRQ